MDSGLPSAGALVEIAPPAPGFDPEREKAALLREMTITKACRFNAAKRLEGRDKVMTQVTAMTSVVTIVITIVLILFRVGELWSNIINVLTILASLLIFALSLLQYSNNDPVHAEQHHRCALEVNALRRALRATQDCSAATIAEFGRRYDEALMRYGINHDDADYEKAKREMPELFVARRG